MVNRREMLAGVLAGTAGATLTGEAAGVDSDAEIMSRLDDIEGLIKVGVGPQYTGALQQLRQSQHAHLRANGSFPRFIEVGSDVWDQAYDWHVVNRRQIEVTRSGDRYQMPFLHATLVLRPDATPSHIGTPTDVRNP